MKHARTDPHLPARRGTAAVEFALVLPVLLLIGLSCVDLGRLIEIEDIVAQAARSGAEYGASHQSTPYTEAAWKAQIVRIATESMQQMRGFDPSLMEVKIKVEGEEKNIRRVKVEVEYRLSTMFIWLGIPETAEVDRTVRMAQFR